MSRHDHLGIPPHGDYTGAELVRLDLTYGIWRSPWPPTRTETLQERAT
ncbi:MAG: hypothetical protein GY745_00030 [Actinomycetia bacterium]|nr:hypothetical protein [Actinomycetes bacterium]